MPDYSVDPISSQLGLLLYKTTQLELLLALDWVVNYVKNIICACGTSVKKDGLHGLSCNKSGGMFPRHGKRPDGMTLIPWRNGRSVLSDVTVRDTLAPRGNSLF